MKTKAQIVKKIAKKHGIPVVEIKLAKDAGNRWKKNAEKIGDCDESWSYGPLWFIGKYRNGGTKFGVWYGTKSGADEVAVLNSLEDAKAYVKEQRKLKVLELVNAASPELLDACKKVLS